MSSYTAVLGNSGPLPRYTDPDTGRVYEVSYLTPAKRAEYELWLEERARGILFRMKKDLAPEEWREEYRTFRDEVTSGRFAFHGPVACAARETPDGIAALAAILFGCTPDEMFDLVSRRGDEVRTMIDLAVARSSARQTDSGGAAGNAPLPAAMPAPMQA